jgi:hypothetical protein
MEDEIRGMTRNLARRERTGPRKKRAGLPNKEGWGVRETTLRGGGENI